MRRIRIATIITRLNVGGPALQVLLVADRLDRERFAVDLISGVLDTREGDMLKLRQAVAVPHVIPELRRSVAPLDDLRALLRLVRLLRRMRPDVVHTHLSKAGALGRIAARLAGTPVVVHTYHGTVFAGYFPRPISALLRLAERVLSAISSALIVISHSQREHIVRLGIAPDAHMVEIPYGLELEPFRHAARGRLRAELGFGPDVPLVGIVGRLVPIKAVDVFLQACAIVARQRPDARFVVVGDGVLASELHALAAKLELADRVSFLGWRGDLPTIYSDLDVLALTSLNEGTPISLIEGLATGCSVVATAVGGVPDVLRGGDFGILVPPASPQAVAHAVVRLLSQPALRSELGARAQTHIYETYDIDQHVSRLSRLYSELLERSEVSTRAVRS